MQGWVELARRWPEARFFAVDNQSTDGTLERLERQLGSSRIQVLATDQSGKIACWKAVWDLIHRAEPPETRSDRDYYLLMDADVTVRDGSVDRVVQAMMEQGADLGSMPLAVGATAGSWWFDFQSVEFTSLYGTGQRLLEQGWATLFSSAFVMVRGDLFGDFLDWHRQLSANGGVGRGPDALWARFLGQRGLSSMRGQQPRRGFRALRGEVEISGVMPPHESVREWVRQRSRWASHALASSEGGGDGMRMGVIGVVLAVQSMVVALWLHPWVLGLWAIKSLVEWRYFGTFSAQIVRRGGLGRFLSYALVYPGLMGWAAMNSLLLLVRRDDSWR